MSSVTRVWGKDLLLGPFILAADLVLLFRCEVVLDVEGLADFLWRLPLDHVGHGLAADIEERLDIQVVGCLEGEENRSAVCSTQKGGRLPTRMISNSISWSTCINF